jgi:hypothetical protein
VKKAPQQATAKLSLDAAQAGAVNIHRINVENDLDAEAKKNLGENPLYFAVRDDALFFSLGDDGLAAIKEALSARPKTGAVMRMDLSMARLAGLMARDQPAAPDAAKEAFKGQAGDRFTISLEGGEELRVKMEMKAAVLRFFALLEEAKKKGN